MAVAWAIDLGSGQRFNKCCKAAAAVAAVAAASTILAKSRTNCSLVAMACAVAALFYYMLVRPPLHVISARATSERAFYDAF